MGLINYIVSGTNVPLVEQLGYSRNSVLVIVTVDDIGFHRDETEASISTLNCGMAKTGSVMVPCLNYLNVLKLWKNNPAMDLGVHLTLTCEWGDKYPWTPILPRSDVPSLYNSSDIMWASVEDLLTHAKREHIRLEMEAQIQALFDEGLNPSHLDPHMDFYYNSNLFADVMEISRKYSLPLRVWKNRRYRMPFITNNLRSLRRKDYIFPNTQMGIYSMGGPHQSHNIRRDKYFEYLKSLKPGVHNIKIHVAHKTEELTYIMGDHYSSIRQIDRDIWSSDETKKAAAEMGIIFIGYRPLQKLQKELMCT